MISAQEAHILMIWFADWLNTAVLSLRSEVEYGKNNNKKGEGPM